MLRFRPHIVHTWLFTGSLWGRLGAILAQAPVIIAAERLVRPEGHDSLAMRLIDKTLAVFTDTITANSQAGINSLMGKGCPATKLRLVFNGVDTNQFSYDGRAEARARMQQELSLSADALLLGMVARLDYTKDYETLLKAIHILVDVGTDVHCLIVGAGPKLQRLELLVGDLGITPTLHFLGKRKDVPFVLKCLDVFVLSSLLEGMPNAVLEAMASGLPVVATDVGGTAEAVVEGETGFLVPTADANTLADRLLLLLRNSVLRAKMGTAGRARAVSVFSIETMVAKTTSLYEELIARKKATYARIC